MMTPDELQELKTLLEKAIRDEDWELVIDAKDLVSEYVECDEEEDEG